MPDVLRPVLRRGVHHTDRNEPAGSAHPLLHPRPHLASQVVGDLPRNLTVHFSATKKGSQFQRLTVLFLLGPVYDVLHGVGPRQAVQIRGGGSQPLTVHISKVRYY